MMRRGLTEEKTEMRYWIFTFVLIFLVAGFALEPLADEVINDDQGRISRVVRDDGVTIEYIYGEDGNLVAEHFSDGTVINHPVDEESG
jgi:YD repeat-containing protein